MSNFLLINKPVDWTSHDVVAVLRKKIGIKKIGHSGTLDPFATGLLIIGVGREATKRLDEFKKLPKTYKALVHLGATSTTYDVTGQLKYTEAGAPADEHVHTALASFIGEQDQIPPMHSAKKIKGKKLYEYARKGIEVERKPSRITIFEIRLVDYHYPFLTIEVVCSTGTYIRSLAHDIGQALGCGAYCEKLVRLAIGEYRLEDAEEVVE